MDLETVKIYQTRIEGEMMVDFLRTNGISSILVGDDAGAMRFHLGMQAGYRLQVYPKDVTEVTELIASLDRQQFEDSFADHPD